MGRRQVVRQRVLVPSFAGSSPADPAMQLSYFFSQIEAIRASFEGTIQLNRQFEVITDIFHFLLSGSGPKYFPDKLRLDGGFNIRTDPLTHDGRTSDGSSTRTDHPHAAKDPGVPSTSLIVQAGALNITHRSSN
jgi:hypothetical protein